MIKLRPPIAQRHPMRRDQSGFTPCLACDGHGIRGNMICISCHGRGAVLVIDMLALLRVAAFVAPIAISMILLLLAVTPS